GTPDRRAVRPAVDARPAQLEVLDPVGLGDVERLQLQPATHQIASVRRRATTDATARRASAARRPSRRSAPSASSRPASGHAAPARRARMTAQVAPLTLATDVATSSTGDRKSV